MIGAHCTTNGLLTCEREVYLRTVLRGPKVLLR